MAAPHEWWALAALAFSLGARHGFDADHLAVVDGLTRYNAAGAAPVARWCGALFSLGHGAIVVAAIVVASAVAARASPPQWLEGFGACVSIGFLLAIGTLNLVAVARAERGQVVVPVGLKGRLLGRIARTGNPLGIAAIGAVFALSFDTISQAMVFAIAATQFGSWPHALAIGLLFTLGMLVTDGLNGLWVARVVRRADRLAAIASRIMAVAVAAISFGVAGLGIARVLSPAISGWTDRNQFGLGAAIVAFMLASLVAGMYASWQATTGARG